MSPDPPPGDRRLPGSERLNSILEGIRSDRSLGSRQLNKQLLGDLLEWSGRIDAVEPEQIRELCGRVRGLRPEMTAIVQTGYRLWEETGGDPSGGSPLERLRAGLETLRQQYNQTLKKMIEHLEEEGLRDRSICTFSRSGTVLDLIENHPTIRTAIVLHSYPGEEGIATAKQLRENVERLTFAYDAEAGNHLPEVDALYLGADALHDDGSIVNKVGSRLLASAARNTPVRVAVDTWKYTPAADCTDEGPDLPSPDDLPDPLRRNHPLFELVPAHLIDTYMTDRGIFHSPQHLHWRLDDLRRAHEHLP